MNKWEIGSEMSAFIEASHRWIHWG